MDKFMDAIGFLFVVGILLLPPLLLFVYFIYKVLEHGFDFSEFKDQRNPLEE